MIKVDNLQLNIEMESFLNRLKRESLERGKSIFSEFKFSNDHIMTNCPYHKGGRERKPSFGVSIDSGLWHCFTCGESGNIVKLVKDVLDFDTYAAAKQWLIDNYDATLYINGNLADVYDNFNKSLSVRKENKLATKIITEYVSEEELKKYRTTHPYMYKRGLTDEVINMFDIGYDDNFKVELKDKEGKSLLDADGRPKLSDPIQCLTFPVRDEKGNTLFVARRSVNTKFFYYPESVEKPLYGLYEMLKYRPDVKEVVVCESMLDALVFWKIPNIVAFALNGVGSALQIRQLNSLKQGIITLCLDSDKAGQNGKRKIASQIKNKYVNEYILPKGCKDANDCTLEQLKRLEKTIVR